MNKYDIDYFIAKFEIIPDRLIIRSKFSASNGAHCANGWCGITTTENVTEEGEALALLTRDLSVTFKEDYCITRWRGRPVTQGTRYANKMAAVNNGYTIEYQQPTPKARILAALRDIKKSQELAKPVIEKQKVYIPMYVSQTIKDQSEQLILS